MARNKNPADMEKYHQANHRERPQRGHFGPFAGMHYQRTQLRRDAPFPGGWTHPHRVAGRVLAGWLFDLTSIPTGVRLRLCAGFGAGGRTIAGAGDWAGFKLRAGLREEPCRN
jgi:hypothetical protein